MPLRPLLHRLDGDRHVVVAGEASCSRAARGSGRRACSCSVSLQGVVGRAATRASRNMPMRCCHAGRGVEPGHEIAAAVFVLADAEAELCRPGPDSLRRARRSRDWSSSRAGTETGAAAGSRRPRRCSPPATIARWRTFTAGRVGRPLWTCRLVGGVCCVRCPSVSTQANSFHVGCSATRPVVIEHRQPVLLRRDDRVDPHQRRAGIERELDRAGERADGQPVDRDGGPLAAAGDAGLVDGQLRGVNVSCGRWCGLSKKTSHFCSGGFCSSTRRLPTVRNHAGSTPSRIVAAAPFLLVASFWISGRRARQVERDLAALAFRHRPARRAGCRSNLRRGRHNRRGSRKDRRACRH